MICWCKYLTAWTCDKLEGVVTPTNFAPVLGALSRNKFQTSITTLVVRYLVLFHSKFPRNCSFKNRFWKTILGSCYEDDIEDYFENVNLVRSGILDWRHIKIKVAIK